MSIQPRYKFDPVSQKYTLLNAQEMAQRNIQERGGLGAMESPSPFYPMDGGGDGTVGGSSVDMTAPGMAEMGVGFQNAGLALSGIPSMTTAVAGAVATGIGNSMMGSEVSPVAPDSAQVSSIAPDPAFSGLAAMNAAVAADDESEAQAAQAVSTVSEIGEAAQQSQASPEAAVAAAAAPAAGPAAAPAPDTADVGVATDSGFGDSGGFSDGFGIGSDGYGGFSAPGGEGPGGEGNAAGTAGVGDGEREGGLISIKKYAYGGMTMAPQNYGRMGDSMMVHMSPQEVAGLQALARSQGTSMTVNPNTGYPEAFNLNALLPVIAGLALGPAGLGLTAAQAGLAVGALGTATTGSLSKGIQAGLGAYGGAGIGGGFVDPSAAATTPPVGLEGAASGSTGVVPTPLPADPSLVGNPYSMASSTPGLPNAVTPGLEGAYNQSLSLNQATLPPVQDFNLASGAPSSTANFLPSESAGLNVSPMQATTAQTAGLSATPTSSPFANMSGKDMFKYGSAAAAPLLGQMAEPVQTGMPSRRATYRPYDFSYNPVTSSYEPTPGDSSERVFLEPTFTPLETYTARSGGQVKAYAAGGLAAFKAGGRPKSRPLMDENDLGGLRFYEMMGEGGSNLSSVEKNFAKGGMPPRFLSGGGDGMSDDIPAVIGDKQPARLADGEFVIPADVVSHIGNGSSKAGAKKLYEMMADIRKSRTGKTKQAPAIKPDKYMPA